MEKLKRHANALVSNVKARERGEKQNFTVRLSKDVIKRFKKACDSQGVQYGSMIEEILADFARDLGVE